MNVDNPLIRMGILMPSIYIGGGEISTLFAIEHTDKRFIKWEIVVVTEKIATEALLMRFADSVQVFFDGYCYYNNSKKAMSMKQALEVLNSCDGVITWELNYKRSRLFNVYKGVKYHWIFRHDEKHKSFVRDEQVLLTCSESCIPDFGSVNPNKIHIIPSAVDLEHCMSKKTRAEIRDNWNITDELVIGYLGRMDKNKNVQAVARAVAYCDKAVAMCYGAKNWQSDKIETEIKNIAAGRLIWHDPILNVGDILYGADILMLPSYSEVFSLTLLEAWAARLPVVCTNVGEVPYLEKKYGSLCTLMKPDDDGKSIYEKIIKAISDTDIIERAYSMVMGNYNEYIVAGMWTKFIMEQHGRSPNDIEI